MTGLVRILLLLYGLALIAGGVMGYVKAQSQESLIAGGASGLAALVAFAVSLRRPKLGFAIGFAVAAAVGYFFMEKYLNPGAAEPAATRRAQMIGFTSLGMVVVLLVGLLLPSRRPPP
jgi:uncharacterized membrane protein (UPF0136 family)